MDTKKRNILIAACAVLLVVAVAASIVARDPGANMPVAGEGATTATEGEAAATPAAITEKGPWAVECMMNDGSVLLGRVEDSERPGDGDTITVINRNTKKGTDIKPGEAKCSFSPE